MRSASPRCRLSTLVVALGCLVPIVACEGSRAADHDAPSAADSAVNVGEVRGGEDGGDGGSESTVVADGSADGDAREDAVAVAAPVPPLPIVAPEGFALIDAGRGVTTYRRDTGGGFADWVTVVDLRVARLRSVVGVVRDAPVGRIERRAAIRHWDDATARATSAQTRARAMAIGIASTDQAEGFAVVQYGLKVLGELISYGKDLERLVGWNMTLAWDDGAASATIGPWKVATFDRFTDVVGGLAHDAPHAERYTLAPRSFAGTRDCDGDGDAEALLLFASERATQASATTALTGFGATALVMLQGGAAVTLVVDGVERVSPSRTSPHVLAVYEGAPPGGCDPPCAAHGACDAATHACDCDPGFSGATCADCAACDVAVVVVDDLDPGFSTFGVATSWWQVSDHDGFATDAEAGGFHYTSGDTSGDQVRTGRWQTPTPLTGRYHIQVRVADPDPFDPWSGTGRGTGSWFPCYVANYVVLHDGAPEGEQVVLDHHTAQWRTLTASATFTERRGDVRSPERASPTSCAVQFDAVRWTRVP